MERPEFEWMRKTALAHVEDAATDLARAAEWAQRTGDTETQREITALREKVGRLAARMGDAL